MSLSYTNIVRTALVYLVIWCICPPLSYGTIYRILAIAVVLGGLFLHQTSGRVLITKYQFRIIILIGYMFIVSWLSGDDIVHRIGTYIFLFILLVSESLWDERFDIKKMYFIIPLAFALFTIWNMRTLQAISEVPNVMRLLAKNSALSISYIRSGVGGYGYMYTVVLFLPVGLDCVFSRHRNMVYRVLAVPFVVTTYIVSFQSQYMLALLLTVILTLLFIGFRVKHRGVRYLLISIILVGFVFLYVNVGEVLLYLRNMIDIRSLKLKLDSMYDLVVNEGSIVDSEFYVRYDRYTDSLLYVMDHPLLGGFSYMVTGNHSHLLDYIAQYGIPMGIFYISTIFRPIFKLNLRTNVYGFVVCIVFFCIILMNTLAYALAAIVFILVPVYYHYVKEREYHE